MKYFAYGSNLDVAQMQRRCPQASVIGVGRLLEYDLQFQYESQNWGGGVANIIGSPGGEVWGLVYLVDSICLDSLDVFEGAPTIYVRSVHSVMMGTERCESWAFHLAEKHPHVPPSRAYLELILTACRDLKFPNHYREAILRAAIPVA